MWPDLNKDEFRGSKIKPTETANMALVSHNHYAVSLIIRQLKYKTFRYH